ncbi:MAG: TetR/AcrR family transcriptional regulator [Myxococcales bacterium]|nr:TetR/AcrR family transcriptional regulator [Myxococcales bacterium]
MAETRTALLDAAAALFAEQGLDVPSLDAICARAGFTRGAFYVHFADRDALVAEVMERDAPALLDALLGKEGEALGIDEIVVRVASTLAQGDYPLLRAGGIMPHQIVDAAVRSPRIRARYADVIATAARRLEALLERARDEGRVRSDVDLTGLSTLLLSAVIGGKTLAELGVPLDPVRAAATVVSLMGVSPGGRRGGGGGAGRRVGRTKPHSERTPVTRRRG